MKAAEFCSTLSISADTSSCIDDLWRKFDHLEAALEQEVRILIRRRQLPARAHEVVGLEIEVLRDMVGEIVELAERSVVGE